jgi:GNAT superfamily N-acetyltransferase
VQIIEATPTVIELHELGAGEGCQNAQLHARVSESSKARYTKQFVVRECGSEVAFLALDQIPDVDYLVLYEIFVPSELRRRGIGSRLLGEVEKIARSLGYEKVTLFPSPLDSGYPENKLIAWYRSHGYAPRPDCPTELEKRFV